MIMKMMTIIIMRKTCKEEHDNENDDDNDYDNDDGWQ